MTPEALDAAYQRNYDAADRREAEAEADEEAADLYDAWRGLFDDEREPVVRGL